jgi:galactonate dehydratase
MLERFRTSSSSRSTPTKAWSRSETWQRPIAPHDCTGPVVLVASLHIALNAQNAIFQEVVRAYYTSWYRDLVTELPRIEGGYAYPMTGAGLGTAVLPDLKRRPHATVRRSALGD